MKNTRRRKNASEYQRGFEAGLEDRKRQPNESRIQRGPYWDGYQAGATLRYRGKAEIEERTKRFDAAADALNPYGRTPAQNGIAGEGPIAA